MRRTVPLVLLVLLSPTAVAEADIEGELAFLTEPTLRGVVRASADAAQLDLTEAFRSGHGLRLSWERAEGRHVAIEWERFHAGPLQDSNVGGLTEVTPIQYKRGSLLSLSCTARCMVVLLALDEGSTLAVGGSMEGPLRRLEKEVTYWAQYEDAAAERDGNAFYEEVARGTVAFAGPGFEKPDATALRDLVASGEGRLGLLVVQAKAQLLNGTRSVEVDTVTRRETLTTPTQQPLKTSERASFLYVELEGAAFETDPGAPVLFTAREPTLALEGALLAGAATGSLEVDGRGQDLSRKSLFLSGNLTALLDSRPFVFPEGTSGVVKEASGVQAEPMRGRLGGDADVVMVAGARVVDKAAPSQALATGVTVAVGLGALWVLLQRGALTLLYSRIARSTVLDNPRRREVYDLLRDRPGMTPTELAEATNLARVVVQHHLRMLETHQLVTQRQESRRRAYYLVGSVPSDDLLGAHALLRDESRRRLAEAVQTSQRPATQGELAAQVGLSPRLVSYHLGHLEKQGLVSSEGAQPRRYRSTSLLLRALTTLERGPA